MKKLINRLQGNNQKDKAARLEKAITQDVHDINTPLVTVNTGVYFARETLERADKAELSSEELEQSHKLLGNALVEIDKINEILKLLHDHVDTDS